MDIFLLKLFLTPLFIAVLTWIGRRWGPMASGAVAGLPLTSGPVSLFLALEQGTDFAVHAAIATLIGLIAVGAFCLFYAVTASRKNWPVSAITAATAFFMSALSLLFVRINLVSAFIAVALFLAMILFLFPRTAAQTNVIAVARPKWDLALRIVIATGLVFLLTAVAPHLGPQATGLSSPFPIFGGVLAIFAHRQVGAFSAQRVLRGVLVASFSFATFFLIVGFMLPRYRIALTYTIAAIVSLAINLALFTRMRSHRSAV